MNRFEDVYPIVIIFIVWFELISIAETKIKVAKYGVNG